ncbi:TetR/AcrR family transcriptional regulator [Paenibacillus sp. SYP-B4298]|uniref:TetR/AcrR family transcriptional regulator n=1 Tax=Paenibacillus sp. SYP-B4298 TaxID=2996034 RepID=UPI0022DE350B|nr:TetR/AcrR family transcriptional regulator [Paenibacillus sp. SYP-B4298]
MSSAHGDKLYLILDTAFKVFGTKGFYETRMSEIADEAGIAKGTLYHYFTSKEELFTAVTKRDHDNFLARLEHTASQPGSLEEQLTRIASTHLHYYYQVRQYTRLFFHVPNNDHKLMLHMRQFLKQYNELVASLLQACGVLQPQLHARSFLGVLEVFKMDILMTEGFGEEDLQQRIDFAVQLFRHGCTLQPHAGVE